MYTGHFGLDDGPFHGKAEGQDVYVGPQQVAVIGRLKKVLSLADTAVSVSGPVGVGKTTLVRRALAELSGQKIVIPVDRIRLEPDEVLDLLLARFDVSRQPKGTIQRVAAFRRLLHERLSNDVRVFIVVEDAERCGVDALIELEALTATDSGEPVGANIVLMGGTELASLLAKPALARLRQRIRLRQHVAPFDGAEVEGYMRHCLETAGGVLEQIFEPGTARVVHRYTGGVARVVDNLCEAALEAAAEIGLATILPEFLQEVAENCGLDAQVGEADEPRGTAPPGPVDVAEASAEAGGEHEAQAEASPPHGPPKLSLVETLPGRDGEDTSAPHDDDPSTHAVEPGGRLEAPDVVVEVADPDASAPEVESATLCAADVDTPPVESHRASLTVSRIDEVLPELIERLQSAAGGHASPPPLDAPEDETDRRDADDIPTLSNSMRVAVLPVAPFEARPLTAEEEPGIHGHAVTERPAPSAFDVAVTPDDEVLPPAAVADDLPDDDDATTEAETLSYDELTPTRAAAADATNVVERRTGDAEAPELDALQAAIQAANAWELNDGESGEVPASTARPAKSTPIVPAIALDADREKEKPVANDADRWAEELSKAKSLEDISDMLAETLFGSEEMQAISAEIRAGTAAGVATPADAEQPKQNPVASPAGTQRPRSDSLPAKVRATAATTAPPKATTVPRPPARPEASPRPPAGSGAGMTRSQRIEMVNSLKGRKPSRLQPRNSVMEIVLGEQPDEPAHDSADRPEPIESQIDIAITQSRKALSEADLARMAARDGDAGKDKGSRGLFGFFRRSSKT